MRNMSNENSRNVFPSEYCCHLIDFAKLAKIHIFRFANSWFDSPMATWRTLTGTLHILGDNLTTLAIRPLFFYFLVYGFLGGKNGSVGRKKRNFFFSKGSIMSSCRKKLPVHGNSIKK